MTETTRSALVALDEAIAFARSAVLWTRLADDSTTTTYPTSRPLFREFHLVTIELALRPGDAWYAFTSPSPTNRREETNR